MTLEEKIRRGAVVIRFVPVRIDEYGCTVTIEGEMFRVSGNSIHATDYIPDAHHGVGKCGGSMTLVWSGTSNHGFKASGGSGGSA